MDVKINRRLTRSCPMKVKLHCNNQSSKDDEASNCQPEVLRSLSGVASYTSFRSRILWSMWGKSHVLAKLDNYFLYYITPCCRNELFCVITQRVATITTYRRFGTTYLSHLQVSSSTFWLLKTGPDRLSRNVGNYLTSLHCLSSQKPQNKSTARQKPNLYYSY